MSLPLYGIGTRVHVHLNTGGPHDGESYEVSGWAEYPDGTWYTLEGHGELMPESYLSECEYEPPGPGGGLKRCPSCGYPRQ